jgi:outer membrane protein
MNRILVLALVTFSLALTSKGFAAEEKFGVVNVQKVLDTVDEGKKAKSQFEQEVLSKKNEVEKKQTELKKMQENYEKQKSILSPSAQEEKRKEYESKAMEYQKYQMQTQTDLAKRERQLADDILNKIRGIVEKIGRDGGYQVIWEKNEGGLIYYKNAYDITSEVIAAYDKQAKK